MNTLRIQLFQRFWIQRDHEPICALLDNKKAQELFCYVLLHPNRSHLREVLAELLWSNATPKQSRKYLRQALWQLQTALDSVTDAARPVLQVNAEWIRLNPVHTLWIDVAEFEARFQQVWGENARELDDQTAATMAEAVALYRGELLEGWYQDWCLQVRERLQNQFLTMLDKLMGYAEQQRAYETALAYGARILHVDAAHERTHQRMIRCWYLSGDRTAALRQYEQCCAALNDELGVEPALQTTTLYESIRADQFDTVRTSEATLQSTPNLLHYLKELQRMLTTLEQQIHVNSGMERS